jgi:glycosyltransferase involved in cell wall biosynthesis
MIRVAHVITNLTTGGAEMMLYRMLQVLDRSRFDAEVFSLKQEHPVGDKIAALGIPVNALHIARVPGPSHVARLARWLRRGRFQVVQTWMTHADLVGGLAAKLAGLLPVAWGLHVGHLDRQTHGRTAIWTARLNARLSHFVPDRIVSCSETSLREHVRLGYAEHKMVVIPNGFDLNAFRPDAAARSDVRRELGLPDDALIVGQVGRFHPQKDHQTFTRAAALVHARHPDAWFVLIGRDTTWENPVLSAWIEETGARDRFRVLGSRDDVPRLTAAMDVACSSSSHGEAFPLVIGEAMGCGVPCAVTDCGDAAIMVGETGRVAPIRDPPAFARGIGELIDLGREGRTRLGLAARRHIEENYALHAIAARYDALYAELAGAPSV